MENCSQEKARTRTLSQGRVLEPDSAETHKLMSEQGVGQRGVVDWKVRSISIGDIASHPRSPAPSRCQRAVQEAATGYRTDARKDMPLVVRRSW